MEHVTLHSPRLGYRVLDEPDLDAFHALITDAHVKRYLCDGQTLPREWAADTIAASKRLFATRGVGLWLMFENVAGAGVPIGFVGFADFSGDVSGAGASRSLAASRSRHPCACSRNSGSRAAAGSPALSDRRSCFVSGREHGPWPAHGGATGPARWSGSRHGRIASCGVRPAAMCYLQGP